MIRLRAKERGSGLPDEFFTRAHFRPKWSGSKNAFLSYVQAIADIYIKTGHEESEVDRIAGILAAEMDIDLSPYQTFAGIIPTTIANHRARQDLKQTMLIQTLKGICGNSCQNQAWRNYLRK